MASVETIEAQIGNLEGFDVRFYHPDGTDVRSDRGKVAQTTGKRYAVTEDL